MIVLAVLAWGVTCYVTICLHHRRIAAKYRLRLDAWRAAYYHSQGQLRAFEIERRTSERGGQSCCRCGEHIDADSPSVTIQSRQSVQTFHRRCFVDHLSQTLGGISHEQEPEGYVQEAE